MASSTSDPEVPAFVADKQFTGPVTDLQYSEFFGGATTSGSNVILEEERTGEQLTVDSFEVTCSP